MDFLNPEELEGEPGLFLPTFTDNDLPTAWQFPTFDATLLTPLGPIESISGSHANRGTKRPRGRTFTGCVTCRERKIKCDGRRPICRNCQRSRLYVCRGFIENSRTLIGGDSQDASEPAAKSRRTESRTVSTAPLFESAPSRELGASIINSTKTAPNTLTAHIHEYGLIPCDASHKDLLEYYRHTVTGVMMPTIDPSSNPWLQIYFPLALGELSTPSQLALRHALISVAAYQRAYREGESKQDDMKKGLYHEQEASRVLERFATHDHLETQSPRDKCTSLAAALGLISIDIFSPRATDCAVRLDLARRVIAVYQDEKPWESSALSSMLYQIFRCYETVASTAKLTAEMTAAPQRHGSELDASSSSDDRNVIAQMNTTTEFEKSFADARYFILNSSFGVSWRTMSLLQETTRLGTACSSSNPKDMTTEIRNLYQRLYGIEDDPSGFLAPVSPNRTIPQVDTSSRRTNNPGGVFLPKVISDELIENHQWAFHYAVIIYFHRVIPDAHLSNLEDDDGFSWEAPDLGRNKSSRDNCQVLVTKVWDRLENIDCLTPRDIQLHRGNVLWPAFIAAAESIRVELRHRALIWFSKAAKRGVGNTLRAKEVVMEVWRRVDRQMYPDEEPAGMGPVDWRVVMKDMGHSIMLT